MVLEQPRGVEGDGVVGPMLQDDACAPAILADPLEVVEEFSSDTYEEGKSDFTDNVIRLLRFLNEFLNA